MSTQKYQGTIPIPHPAEVRHNSNRGLSSDHIFAPLSFDNDEITVLIPAVTTSNEITLFGSFENSGLLAYLLVREFIKLTKTNIFPQNLRRIIEQIRNIRREEKKNTTVING